jgi:hypothetical protein
LTAALNSVQLFALLGGRTPSSTELEAAGPYMARGDNRCSLKMRQKKSQAKYKARLKKRRLAPAKTAA